MLGLAFGCKYMSLLMIGAGYAGASLCRKYHLQRPLYRLWRCWTGGDARLTLSVNSRLTTEAKVKYAEIHLDSDIVLRLTAGRYVGLKFPCSVLRCQSIETGHCDYRLLISVSTAPITLVRK